MVGPDVVGPDVVGPDVVGPDVVGPDVVGPDVVGPDVVGPGVVGAEADGDEEAAAGGSGDGSGADDSLTQGRIRPPGPTPEAVHHDEMSGAPPDLPVHSSGRPLTMRIASRMDRMGTEAAFRVLSRARALEAEGRDVIHLEMGEPDFPTPPHIVDAAIQALRDGKTGYSPAAGIPALRRAIAEDVGRTRGIAVDPASVVVCPGGKPVIFYTLLALVEAGDEVVYPDPGFPIFESMTDALGAKRSPYGPGSGRASRPDVDHLASCINDQTRLLVLNSPGNPTGVVFTREELEAIAALCRERDIWILSDEIYSRILFGREHESIASLDGMQDKTIILDGFSKTYSMTGWRLGYAVAPPALAPLYEKLMTNSNSCAVHFVQHAALAALQGPQDAVHTMVGEFERRRDALVDGLQDVPGIECDRPEGSFFAFADVTGTGVDARTLSERLLEEAGVACVEGDAFGSAGAGHVRFSFAASVERIQEAVTRMRNLLAG